MPTLPTAALPPPLGWDELEEMCWDLFSVEWQDPNAVRHGRQGQRQDGVDIYGRKSGRGRSIGVQCKLHGQTSALTSKEVEAEVAKAEQFVPSLGAFIIATTAARDAALQRSVRQFSDARLATGAFPVQLRFWEDLRSRLARMPAMAQRHYPQFFVTREDEWIELERAQMRHAEERDRPRFEARQAGASRLVTAYEPQWKIGQISGDPIANLQWRFRGPRFPMEWRDAIRSALDRTNFSARFDLTRELTEEDSDELVGADELGLEIRFHWHGAWRHELHRYPIVFRPGNAGMLCDVKEERLPPIYYDGD